jgi:hypothetical protein
MLAASGLDHGVLVSEAGVVVNTRDSKVVARSKWSAVESARGLQSARQPPRADRAENIHESCSRGEPRRELHARPRCQA